MVARTVGVSVRTVKRVAKEVRGLGSLQTQRVRRRRVGRPSVVRRFRTQIEGLLKLRPNIQTSEILRIVRALGYRGGRSAFYALVASLRQPCATTDPVSRRSTSERSWLPRATNGAQAAEASPESHLVHGRPTAR